ncbi:ommochrome-binding protein-like [Galleria mellonella]|uniref:Ommochrome-binding protein-like n=1 Tax=Galleria mellonella TaxID=7137 RepID=A0ABM3MIL1_GALME|nr:ommochrome-binding protein-like [Galleria mellonella]
MRITIVLGQRTTDSILCDGIIFHNVYYDKELLFNNLGKPYNLILHKFSGILFFSHTLQNDTHTDFAIMACDVNKKQCSNIQGVPGGYAIAYDPGNDDIFFGGHDGIYKYNFLTGSAEFFAEEGKSIWGLFVRRNFYYIEYPTQKLYVYNDDSFVEVAEARNIEVDHFFISRNMDIYFSNKTALYKVEKNTKRPIVLNDEIIIRQIVEDGYGDTYFCGSDGIYIEDKPYHRISKLADINQAFGLAFDEHDHILYSDQDAIYKLLHSNYSIICHELLVSPKEKEQ